jgi:ParB-like chromosome segregation protein Spo0J
MEAIKHYKSLPVSKLVKAEWNYKENDPELLEKLISNIKRNNQLENLIVRKLPTGFYEIVNGNHRYDALVAMGADEAVVYDCGDISDEHAVRIAIETNETTFETDYIKLSNLMKKIAQKFSVDELKITMPFSDKQLDNLMQATSFDWTRLPEVESGEGYGEESEEDSDDVFEEVKLNLPKIVATMLEQQMERVKDICNFKSKVSVIESICVALAHMDDVTLREELLGAG